MARRRVKKRTHVGARNGPTNGVPANTAASRSPKSMVIRIGAGEVGPSVSQLVKDVRHMMEPGTASRLKERRSNRLRDYTTMAGPLGVSHLLLFSRSTTGNTNLRLAITPRGPTLHFRIEQYSLCKDIQRAQKHPKAGGKEYLSPPLLVMNNFTSPPPSEGSSSPTVPKHLESLTTTIFQSLFPPISPQTTPLSSIRRVLLLNRELPSSSSSTTTTSSSEQPDTAPYTLTLRHYAITTKRTGLSRGIRRLNAAEKMIRHRKGRPNSLPNLGNLEDVADYLLDPSATTAGGYTSATESEPETDAEVEVLDTHARKVMTKKQLDRMRAADGARGRKSDSIGGGRGEVEKRAVKLVELGPRLKLRMTKVEEGVCAGKVLWHEYLRKSKEEERRMEGLWEGRWRERDERRGVQRGNVERKRRERGEKGKERGGDGGDGGVGEEGDEEMDVQTDEYEDEWDSEGLEGDAEMEVNEEAEAEGEFSAQEEEIAAG